MRTRRSASVFWLARSKSRCDKIVENAGEDAAVILNQVKDGKGAFGYNAATGEFGDMLEEGILDPTKVTRLALQNAASVAGLLLTTEVMVAEAPKDEEHSPRRHAGRRRNGRDGHVRRFSSAARMSHEETSSERSVSIHRGRRLKHS